MAEIVLSTAGSVWKVVRAIREAVATDRRNHKEYRDILRTVDRVSSTLNYFKGASKLAAVLTPVLDDLAGSLDEALQLIKRCQGRSTIHRFFVAEETAKALRRVKDDIEHHLQIGIFVGMMQIFTLTNAVQQPHQISMIFISVDLGCSQSYRKVQVTLCEIRENEMMTRAKIKFDTANYKVIIAGQFDTVWLSNMICSRAANVVKQIEITEEEKEKEEEEDEEEELDNAVQGTRELTLRPQSPHHTTKASEGSPSQPAALEHPDLLEGRESTPRRTPEQGTGRPAAESHVAPTLQLL